MAADWRTYNLDGRALNVLHQQFTDGCALACVAMVVNRRDGSRPTERAVMNVLGTSGYTPQPQLQRYIPAMQDRVAHTTTNFGYSGTYAIAVPNYLRAYRIIANHCDFPNESDFTTFIDKKYDPRFPLILKVRVGSLSHFIVLEGFQTADTYRTEVIISDPAKLPYGGAKLGALGLVRGRQNMITSADKLVYTVREGIQCSW
jgi:predicted double-glycine peptidase